jgi:hypothetical protein
VLRATALTEFDGAKELDEGLDIVLGGLRRQLEPGGSSHLK